MVRALVYLLFFLSGATALVYEVAWTRRLILLLGSTTVAVSMILAAWMLGLALGARIFGPLADRTRRPLLLYAVLEAGIGILALLFPLLLAAARAGSLVAGGSRVAAWLLAFAALLLPTILMGGTLPLLSRFVVTRLSGMGGRIGLLYGLNTWGAVLGTFLAGFFLVRLLGVYGSTYLAAAINLAIAGAAAVLALRETSGPYPNVPEAESEAESDAPEPDSAPPETSDGSLRPALAIAFAAGLISLGSEVLWTRMLVFFLEGFTYTFSAMLTTFLAGLALGAWISGRLVDRIRNLRAYVGWLFLVSAVLSAGALFLLTRSYGLANFARQFTAGVSENWRVHHGFSLFVTSFVVLFPPALVMGGIFPALARLATRSLGEVGSKVGKVYAANTLGAVAGALLAGLILVRFPGMAWGAGLLAIAGAGVGILLLGRRMLPGLPLAAGAVTLIVFASPWTPFVRHSHVFQGERGLERELRSYQEGAYAAVSVVDDVRSGIRILYTDEFQAAATGVHYKYMRMLAHLPLLLSDRWEGAEVLVICFGTGTTAGSAAQHPLGGLDVVEISQEVLDHAPFFTEVNKGVLEDDPDRPFPVRVHVDDGRNFLLRNPDKKWDVVTLEPLMPYTPGAVTLYTRDFYELARERLADDGLMCQWIPIHAMASEDYRMLIRSFTDVFPHTSLWFVEGTSMVIGSREPLRPLLARVKERMEHPSVKADLGAVGFDDPTLALAALVSREEELLGFVAGDETMTDENPIMEFHPLPSRWLNSFLLDNLAILFNLRAHLDRKPDLSALVAADRDAIESALSAEATPEEMFQMVGEHYLGGTLDLSAMSEELRKDLMATAGRFYCGGDIDLSGIADDERRDTMAGLGRAWLGVQHFLHAEYLMAKAGYYDAEKDRRNQGEYIAKAVKAYELALALSPNDHSIQALRKNAFYMVLISNGRREEDRRRLIQAAAAFQAAAALDSPNKPDLAYTYLGRVLNRLKRPKKALSILNRALEHFPKSSTALAERGLARYSLGDEAGALADFRAAFASSIQPETDGELMAAFGRLTGKAENALMPEHDEDEARQLLNRLRVAEEGEVRKLIGLLRAVYNTDKEQVRAALAPDLARSRDPNAPQAAQEFALDVVVAVGDLESTLDLLETGVVGVRESAAGRLGRVKRKPVVPALIAAMEDPDAGVRVAAWSSFVVLTAKKDSGYRPDATAGERAEALSRLRRWWDKLKDAWEPR